MTPQHSINITDGGLTKDYYWQAWPTGGPTPSLTAVVAVVNSWDGHPKDWAVYIGALSGPSDDKDTALYVARYGHKLPQSLAVAFFGELTTARYRD